MSDSIKYSADWIKEQVNDRYYLPIRRCSMCRTALNYIVLDGRVFFDSNCECVSYTTPPRPSSWDAIAELLAAQSSDEIRDHVMMTLKGEVEPA